MIATFVDDTTILAITISAEESTELLQTAVDSAISWTKNWRIKLNHQKSVHVGLQHDALLKQTFI